MKPGSRSRLLFFLIFGGLIVTVTSFADSKKKPNDACTTDSECRGHCFTKKSDSKKVCVDCSSSTIERTRALVTKWCKGPPRSCTVLPRTAEISEDYFKDRLEANEECAKARTEENRSCWAGGDDGHREAVKEAEKARKTCNDELNRNKGLGLIYNCSDSTYSSKSSEVTRYCGAYGKACEAWSKNSDVVDCRAIEDAMKKSTSAWTPWSRWTIHACRA